MNSLVSVDCVWSTWSDWEECSVTCGGGSQNRDRITEGPFYGGAECTGDVQSTRDCNTDECPGR